MEEQDQFFNPTADSPKGDTAKAEEGQPSSAGCVVPKGQKRRGEALSTITMEEIAKEENLRRAFKKVKANRGAPGIDGRTVEEVEEHLDEIVPRVSRELLSGRYESGAIRRVWIPKSGGGQRGLG